MTSASSIGERERILRVGGREIRVAVRPGTEPGPPLLLCNGIGASLELLEPFVEKFDPCVDVVRFDAPGVGGSPTPTVPYRFSGLACRLNQAMQTLGYDEYDVLGISWGGGLAQQIALQHPRRCRRVVLVATGTGALMVPAKLSVLSKMVTPRRYRDPTYARAVAAEMYGGSVRSRPDLVEKLFQRAERLGSTRGYVFQLLAGTGWTSLPYLPMVRQRALVLAGSDDPLIPLANAHIMTTLLPHATLHIYQDGHLGLLTLAEELGQRVSRFLRDDQPPGTADAGI